MTLAWIICNKKSVVCTSSVNYEKNWHSYWVISNQWYEMCLTLPLNERELMFLLPCKEEWVINRLHFSLLFLLYIISFPLLKNCLLLQVTVTFRCYVSGIYGSKVRKSPKECCISSWGVPGLRNQNEWVLTTLSGDFFLFPVGSEKIVLTGYSFSLSASFWLNSSQWLQVVIVTSSGCDVKWCQSLNKKFAYFFLPEQVTGSM